MAAISVNDTSIDPTNVENAFSRDGLQIGVVVLGAIAGSMLFVAIIIVMILKVRERIQLKRDREGHHAYGERAQIAVNQALGRHEEIAVGQAPGATGAGFEVQWKRSHDRAITRNAFYRG